MSKLSKVSVAVALVAGFALVLPGAAQARYRHHHGWYGGGRHGWYGGGFGPGFALGFGLGAAAPYYYDPPSSYYPPSYYRPPRCEWVSVRYWRYGRWHWRRVRRCW